MGGTGWQLVLQQFQVHIILKNILMKEIKIKRIYDAPSEDDGYRVLVDRLWPRGVSKAKAQIDEWNKEVTPSTELRKWFGHKAEKYDDFSALYREELLHQTEEIDRIRTIANSQNVTLLYAARDPIINHARILLDVILNNKV